MNIRRSPRLWLPPGLRGHPSAWSIRYDPNLTTGGGGASYDYYISPTGSDSNAGTQAQPWALTAINTKRATYAGKRVGFLDGTYNVFNLYGAPPGGADTTTGWMVVTGGPSDSQRTVFQSVNPLGAIIDGDRAGHAANLAATIACDGSGSSNFTLDGFKIIRGNHMAFMHNQCSNITVQNNWFDDNNYSQGVGSGQNAGNIRGLSGSNILISNDLFTNFGASADGERISAVQWINNGSVGVSDSVIEYCTAIYSGSGASANGWHIKNPGSNRNTIRYNYVEMAAGNPILWHGNSNNSTGRESLHHNVLVARGELGIICGEDVDSVLVPFDIYNNCLVGNPDFKTCGLRMFTTGSLINFYNNILQRSNYGFRRDFDLTSSSTPNVWDYNFYGDGSPEMGVTTGSGASAFTATLAAWRSATGKDNNALQAASAGFTSVGTYAQLYQLAGGSPCKLTGKSDGTSSGTDVDMGAWGNGSHTRIGSNVQ